MTSGEICEEVIKEVLSYITAVELAWRDSEAIFSMQHYFKEETDNKGCLTMRIAHNPIFSKSSRW